MRVKDVIETEAEIRRGIIKELKEMSLKALDRVAVYIDKEDWDKAIGGLDTIEYVMRTAKECSQKL